MATINTGDCGGKGKLQGGGCKSCIEHYKNNVFSPLSEEEIDFLVDKKRQIVYNVGETIAKQNTASTSVICINEGLAKFYVESTNGKNVIIRIAKAGDFITGGGLFNGNVQHFSVSAITKVKCCMIDSANLTSILEKNSDFAVKLLRNHTKQNNYLLKKLVDHTQKYMPGRVADTLLYLKRDIFNSDSFVVPLTRQELAEMSNMTKESFVRILHQFKDSNYIDTKGNTISILDESSLVSISENG
ncbi:Crp/Fnr family transcriptional regulator [Draconibacterium sp. IB214405]|uniref:Crp/Fnr family transcriptional regulator n=1 Tax=Draconibacterium sp. IB214405 TaxID=3097352 RepID=UPI002A10C291|nr:Crp/Fnr family transcriptional regulator [Draconibacterium sp. IB214405]MDX8340190.1 Crp/Fnr family transcriptional regulator [Draconibacterium sp. IB214405]